MALIKVTPEELKAKGDAFNDLASRMQRNTSSIFEKVESLKAMWKGEAYDAFYTRIKGFEGDLQSLKLLMDKYGEYLDVEHANYLNAEAKIIEAARDKLSSAL